MRILECAGLDPNRDFRPEQWRGACAVADVYAEAEPKNPRSLLLEAPTGIGKTLMYLGPLSLYDCSVVISTSGKLLQRQIADFAGEKLGLDSVVLMGRNNYLCRECCLHYLENMPEDHELHPELARLCERLEDETIHEFARFQQLGWSRNFLDFMRRQLTAASAFCRNNAHECFYTELERKAAYSPLVILNHHVLFSLGENCLSQGKILIADEAHALPEAASNVLSKSISTSQLRALQNQAELCREFCADAVDEFDAVLERLIRRFTEQARKETFVRVGRIQLDWLPERPFAYQSSSPFCRAVCEELNAAWQEIVQSIRGMAERLEDRDWVCYLEAGMNDQVTLKCTPIKTAPLLREFWSRWWGTVGLSATLAMPGAADGEEFHYFRRKCGFPQPTAPDLILKSPFELKKQCRVFVPARGTDYDCRPERDPELFLKKRIELAGSMIQAFDGRTLALYTASCRREAAAAVLKPLFRERLLVQDEDNMTNDELAEQFAAVPGSALLGGKSFFTGFDVPGESLSCEILEKLPFRYRNDPVLEAETRNVEESGDGNGFQEVVLPAMLMELRQAFGRLIRSRTDRGIFILPDSRFLDKNYRDAVIDAFDGIAIEEFSSPAELAAGIPADFLPFSLKDCSEFGAHFEEEWKKFRDTELFRRLTGLRSCRDILVQLKIPELYDWQTTVIDNVLNGIPAQFVIYPAGSGKSLTYQIPALMRPGLTLVISPLKALMYDQVQSLRDKGIREAAFFNSDLSQEERDAIMNRLEQRKIRLLYVAPERLHKSFIKRILNLPQGISMLVIDEAHMISEAGSQWRPFYGELAYAWELFGKPQLLAVTATAGKRIKEEVQAQFGIPDSCVYENTVVRTRVMISVNFADNVYEQKQKALAFVRRAQGRPVLVYCSQINYVHDLVSFLKVNIPDLPIGVYYTGKDKSERQLSAEELNETHRRFLENRIRVLVATCAYGMGIDKPDIWGVLYNNVPASLEEFVQGAGRVCRDRKLLLEYSEAGCPPIVSVTCARGDLLELDKINKPFNLVEALGTLIIIQMKDWKEKADCIAGGGELGNDFVCSCQTIFETVDEDKLKACILLARFLRDRNCLQDGSFDWRRSEFIFSGIAAIPDRSQFSEWVNARKQERIRQQADFLRFCLTSGCRNEFLQIYFTGAAGSERKCHCCDVCGYDLTEHLKYAESIDSTFEGCVSRFTCGKFNGNEEQLLQYLRKISDAQLPAQIAYLHREHQESGQEYSDADFAAALLELRNETADQKLIFATLCRLNRILAATGKRGSRRQLLHDFVDGYGIQKWEPVLDFLAEFQRFSAKYRGWELMWVNPGILQECAGLNKHLEALHDAGVKAELGKWIEQEMKPFGEFISSLRWTECVYYICRGRALLNLLLENPSEEEKLAADSDWQRLRKYIDYIILLEKEEPEKFCQLCDFVKTLPEDQRSEWELILSAPEDFAGLNNMDDSSPEWFCHSPVSRSRLLHCREFSREILLREMEAAEAKMPIARWRDLLTLMPVACKLYPEYSRWIQLAEKRKEEGSSLKLPDCLRYFLQRKVVLAAPQSSADAG